jgi:hypothetical protein
MVKNPNPALRSILLTFNAEALKQLRIVESTPEEDSPLSDLIPEERKLVEEFARKLRVSNLGLVYRWFVLTPLQNKRTGSETNVSVKLEHGREVLSADSWKRSRTAGKSNIIDLTAD